MAPLEDIELANPDWGCDFEFEICVVWSITPQGTTQDEAEKYIRLVGIMNDVSLRNLIPGVELAKGFGFFGSKPASTIAPILVTPDELGDKWKEGCLHLPLITHYKGAKGQILMLT